MKKLKLPLWILLFGVTALALLEVALRASHYGYDTRYWLPDAATNTWKSNPSYYRNWLPPATLVEPTHSVVSQDKSTSRKRVLLVGSSALQGRHAAEFNISKQLGVLLGTNTYEVIEAALPGIDSTAVTAMLKDSLKLAPDICIIHCGHQEFLHAGKPPQRHTPWKVKQWAQGLREGGNTGPLWKGPQTFIENLLPLDSAKTDPIYETFKKNVETMAALCEAKGISIYFCTLPSNIVDIPPFISGTSKKLSKDQLEHLAAQVTKAQHLFLRGKSQQALDTLSPALKIDDHYGEAHHVLATILINNQREGLARAHYERALDLDTLHRRADSRINESIAQAPGSVIDLRKTIPTLRNDLFHDHIHLNVTGNYIAARQIHQAITQQEGSLDEAATKALMGYDDAQASEITSAFLHDQIRPPHTFAWNYRPRFNHFAPGLQPVAMDPPKTASENPFDLEALLAVKHDAPETAIATHLLLSKRFQDCPEVFAALGDSYLKANKLKDAQKNYTKARALSPGNVAAGIGLATLRLKTGDRQAALDLMNKTISAHPDDPRLNFTIGQIFLDAKYYSQAESYLQRALRFAPDNPRWQATAKQASEGLGDLPRKLNNEGTELMKKEQYAAAIQKYREAVSVAPDAIPALNNLAYVLATSPDDAVRNGAEAVKLSKRVMKQHPDIPQPGYRATLAAALAETGDFDGAVENIIQAIHESEKLNMSTERQMFLQILEQYKEGEPYRHQVNM